MGDWKKEIF